ncbi:MAG: hypothetical protein JO319_11550 [Acidobacteriaceae bacterium]|nr:hypothetical protein [Acidobacteriaceae bacterium]
MTRWLHRVALVAIAALLLNGECYARCVLACHDSDHAHVACHHSSSSKPGGSSTCKHFYLQTFKLEGTNACDGSLAPRNSPDLFALDLPGIRPGFGPFLYAFTRYGRAPANSSGKLGLILRI